MQFLFTPKGLRCQQISCRAESGDINLFFCLRLSGPSRRRFAQVTTRQPFPYRNQLLTACRPTRPRLQPEPGRRLIVFATGKLLSLGDPSQQRPVLSQRIDFRNPRIGKRLPRADAPRGSLMGGTRNNDGREPGPAGMLCARRIY